VLHDLITAKPRHHVRFPQILPGGSHHGTEDLVTRGVPEPVIYGLEVVQVDVDQGKGAFRSLKAPDFHLHQVIKEPRIGRCDKNLLFTAQSINQA
jgi:hypothetical protein